jgi:hypothetical protein
VLGGSIFLEPILIFLALLLAFVWWMDKRPTDGTVPTRAVVAGILALLITFSLLRWVWFALFVSLGGLMIAAVIAHGVGTAVAMALELPSERRTLQMISRRVGIAAVCAVILWFAIRWLYTSIAYAAPSLYREYGGVEAILTAAVAYALCALAARRVEPAWPRYAAPLAMVAVVVTCIILLAMIYTPPPAYQLGPVRGGPNLPMPAQPLPSPR